MMCKAITIRAIIVPMSPEQKLSEAIKITQKRFFIVLKCYAITQKWNVAILLLRYNA
jgi:hypothetical protein